MDFNLPGLFRHTCVEATNLGRYHVTITIAEDDKDEFIMALRDTRFIRENGGIAAVPMGINLLNVSYDLDASYNVPSGTMVVEYS